MYKHYKRMRAFASAQTCYPKCLPPKMFAPTLPKHTLRACTGRRHEP